MEAYYEALKNRLNAVDIYVYPAIRGMYCSQKYGEDIITFEIFQNQKYVRYGFDEFQKRIDNAKLCEYGKFISPRKCSISSLINALKKMDEDLYLDGCCLIEYDGIMEYIPSFNCSNCSFQFRHWLYDTVEFYDSFDEFQTLISNCSKNEFILQFACKYYFYLLQEYRINQEEILDFAEFKNKLMDEKKILQIP